MVVKSYQWINSLPLLHETSRNVHSYAGEANKINITYSIVQRQCDSLSISQTVVTMFLSFFFFVAWDGCLHRISASLQPHKRALPERHIQIERASAASTCSSQQVWLFSYSTIKSDFKEVPAKDFFKRDEKLALTVFSLNKVQRHTSYLIIHQNWASAGLGSAWLSVNEDNLPGYGDFQVPLSVYFSGLREHV